MSSLLQRWIQKFLVDRPLFGDLVKEVRLHDDRRAFPGSDLGNILI
jgi:hypothetical protein